MDPVSDHELLFRFARFGDDGAFRVLVERHLPAVRAHAFARTGKTDLADDLAQETFVLLAREAKRIKAGSVISGWLFLTSRHLAHKALRSERRRRLREHSYSTDLLMDASQSHEPDIPSPALIEAMDKLRSREREVLLLRYFENRSFREIAASTGGSEESIRKCAGRSLEKLRPFLARKGITSTAGILGTSLQGMAAVSVPAGMAATISAKAIALTATGKTATVTLSSITTLLVMNTKTLLSTAALLAVVATTGYLVVHSEEKSRLAKPANVRPAAEVVSQSAAPAAAPGLAGASRRPVATSRRPPDSEEARLLAAAESYASSTEQDIAERIQWNKEMIAAAKSPDFAGEHLQNALAMLGNHLALDEAALSHATESLRAFERQKALQEREPELARLEQVARCKKELRLTIGAVLVDLHDDNRAAFDRISSSWSDETKATVLDYLVDRSFMQDFRTPPPVITATRNNSMAANDWSEFPDAVAAIRKALPGDQLEKFDHFAANRQDILLEERAFARSQELAKSLQLDATQRNAVFQELMTAKKEDPEKIKALLNETQVRDYTE